ncbi:MAG: hypothetical protein ISN28_14705 [Ectothiorhodospiraceae bacterium AqS1]|nr:hypothetical protein [Ectothiorhodospiraceae bacterium AqS1]
MNFRHPSREISIPSKKPKLIASDDPSMRSSVSSAPGSTAGIPGDRSATSPFYNNPTPSTSPFRGEADRDF